MYAAAFFYKSGEANIIDCFCTHPTSFELYRSCAKYVSRILMSLRDVKVEKWSSFCSTCSVMAEKSSPATPCVRSCSSVAMAKNQKQKLEEIPTRGQAPAKNDLSQNGYGWNSAHCSLTSQLPFEHMCELSRRERERETKRDRERERDRQRERQGERERGRGREREGEREGE